MRKIIKINVSGETPEIFHSLKTFFAKYPEYLSKKYSIENCLSRKKKPFETVDFTLFRLYVN